MNRNEIKQREKERESNQFSQIRCVFRVTCKNHGMCVNCIERYYTKNIEKKKKKQISQIRRSQFQVEKSCNSCGAYQLRSTHYGQNLYQEMRSAEYT